MESLKPISRLWTSKVPIPHSLNMWVRHCLIHSSKVLTTLDNSAARIKQGSHQPRRWLLSPLRCSSEHKVPATHLHLLFLFCTTFNTRHRISILLHPFNMMQLNQISSNFASVQTWIVPNSTQTQQISLSNLIGRFSRTLISRHSANTQIHHWNVHVPAKARKLRHSHALFPTPREPGTVKNGSHQSKPINAVTGLLCMARSRNIPAGWLHVSATFLDVRGRSLASS
jgi:hypothetical protein